MSADQQPPPARRFFVGVNLPWLTYGCDFGANAWQPDGGVGQPDRLRRLDEVFARLAASDLRTVRWFVFCDGRAGIEFDAHGMPLGLDRFFQRDFETGLTAASRHGLLVIPVLFDFLWCARRRRVHGVPLGGRRAVFADASKRQALLERVVQPLLRAYGRGPGIYAWDLFNEPEWATLGYGSANPLTGLRPALMRGVLRDLALLAVDEVRQGITVGLATRRGLTLLRGAPISEVQVHWYDRRAKALHAIAESERPVLLGEFPTKGSALSPASILEAAEACGYCGALGWSAVATDPHSDLDALEKAVRPRRG